ncbi:MAG: aldo/keto reductase [Caldilineaceae bacterium]|nr:aldo/keto reductase [Caldilineaceae bacterium]MDE0070000.1 aldo/keto reductase [Caldilineaceae bacterium]
MEIRRLGKSELQVSSIGLGSVTFGREIDAQTAYSIIDYALEREINLIDTAEAYSAGGSETVLGEWLSRGSNRQKVVLATKVGPPLGGERIQRAAEDSLRRLQTDVIDLYQLHAFDADTPIEETLGALNGLVEQGKIRYIGCSNFAAWQLCKALWKAEVNGWAAMVSVQPNYNLAVRDIEAELLPFCADQNLGVISYSPLGAGFLTGKYHKTWTAPKGTRFDVIPDHWDIYENDLSMRRMEGLRTVAAETGISMVQLALAWAIGQPGITTVLIGCRKLSHVDQAFEAEAMGLSGELRDRLNGLG